MSRFDKIGTNAGHGHAWARPDGVKMRCGGVRLCAQCASDAGLVADALAEGKASKVKIETIDITPTWSAVVPIIIMGIENGTPASRQIAIQELRRMADLADLYVHFHNEKKANV